MRVEIEIDQSTAAVDGESKRKMQISIGEEGVTFGRSQVNCEEAGFVGICDAKASGEHLLMFKRDGELLVRDLRSKNGTKVNQTRLGGGEEVKWNVGQVIEIGAMTRIKLVEIKPESCTFIETPTKESGVVDECFFCLRNLSKFSMLEKQLHINGCAESMQGNDTAIVQAMSNSSSNNNTCIVCNKFLAALTTIQATNHINKCLDGKFPATTSDKHDTTTTTEVTNKRIKQNNKKPPTAVTTSKRKKTPGTSTSFVASSSATSGLDKFAFTRRTSPLVEMLGEKDDHDMFERACESRALAAISKFDESDNVFEHTTDPFRISLSKELDLTELLRRKDYFEKQLRFCNELLEAKRQPSASAAAATTTKASPPCSFSSFTHVVDTPTPRFPINWNGLTEMDAVLETLSSVCNELEQNDKERMDKLKV